MTTFSETSTATLTARTDRTRRRSPNAGGSGILVFLLIPRRIKQIKDEGFREGLEQVRAERREKLLEERRAERREKLLEERRAEERRAEIASEDERGRVRRLFALYDRGEITLDEFLRVILSDRSNGENGTD